MYGNHFLSQFPFTMSDIQERVENNQRNQQNDWFSQFFPFRLIKCEDKISGFLITIIGLIISLWANCMLIVVFYQGCDEAVEHFVDRTIIYTSQITHFLIVLTCSAGLIYGIKVKNRSLFTPWLLNKVLEITALFLGILFLLIESNKKYVGIVPFGLCFLVVGVYIVLSVWSTYRKKNSENALENDPNVNDSECEPPPSYETYALQILTS